MSYCQLVFRQLMCSGNSFNVDREAMAKELDFDGILNNSMNAVADRDFVLEASQWGSVLLVVVFFQS